MSSCREGLNFSGGSGGGGGVYGGGGYLPDQLAFPACEAAAAEGRAG